MLNDPMKRPLLTPEQLRVISRGLQPKPRKGSPREEFEKLFRQPAISPSVAPGTTGEAN
jgi:hypothetical protein